MVSIVDPSVFRGCCLEIPGYKENLEVFLQGVLSNTLVLIDRAGNWKARLKDECAKWTSARGKHIEILLTEVLKRGKKRLVPVIRQVSWESCSKDTLISLALEHRVDACVVSRCDGVANGGMENVLLPITEYIGSEFEEKRRRFIEEGCHLDQVSESVVTEVISRIVRYTRVIRFYDKQIGRVNNLENFRRGIEFILDAWLANRGGGEATELSVDIVTCVGGWVARSNGGNGGYSGPNRQDVCTVIKNALIEPLERKYAVRYPNLRMSLVVKVDATHEFHGRYLQTEQVVANFERGFDFIRPRGQGFRRTVVRLDNQGERELASWWALRDVS